MPLRTVRPRRYAWFGPGLPLRRVLLCRWALFCLGMPLCSVVRCTAATSRRVPRGNAALCCAGLGCRYALLWCAATPSLALFCRCVASRHVLACRFVWCSPGSPLGLVVAGVQVLLRLGRIRRRAGRCGGAPLGSVRSRVAARSRCVLSCRSVQCRVAAGPRAGTSRLAALPGLAKRRIAASYCAVTFGFAASPGLAWICRLVSVRPGLAAVLRGARFGRCVRWGLAASP